MKANRRPGILHIVDDLDIGGVQRRLLDLVEQTHDRFDHMICCVRHGNALAERFERLGVPVMALNKRPGHDWLLWLRIARQCRTLQPDVVHARNWGTIDGIPGAFLARVPIVIFGEHGKDKPIVPKRRAWVLRGLAPFVDVFVAVNGSIADWLCVDVGISRRRIAVIRNGVDVKRFAPREDRARLREALGYKPGDRVIGSVARLQPVKDFVGLIAAFAALSKRRTDARLLIIGEGPERTSIAREIVRLHLDDVVLLAGHQEHVEDWLPVMDVFVQASRTEGLPSSVLEAMAVGLPVVATRAGGLVEIVADGKTGRSVEVGDTAALADAMETYCADAELCAQHGAAGRRRVHDEFSSQRMVAGYCHLYQQLLAGRGLCAGVAEEG